MKFSRCFAVKLKITTVFVLIALFQNTLFSIEFGVADAKNNKNKPNNSLVSPTAAFTNGNLAVLQAAASVSNTTASIVELNPTTPGVNPVQTIAISGTGANALRISGSATSTAYLATTNDGTLLTFNGANSTDTTTNVNALNPRGVGSLNSSGTFVLQTTYTGTSGNQTRGSTSLNNANWFIADQGGIYTNGSTSASPSGNFRAAKSFGGTVYIGQASGTVTTTQVATVSAPTGGTVTGLPGLSNNASLQDFYLISSGDNGAAFDVLYTISATSNTAGTIAKFSLVGGNWTANGTYTTTFGGFGLAAADNGNGAFLCASTGLGALTANSVIRLADNAGYNAAINITTANNLSLYTAPAGNIIKGVAFAPRPAAVNAPEINVTGNNISITDGDTTPQTADFTDFGNVAVGSSFDRTYLIQNLGSADLTGGAITFSGTNSGEFSVQAAPTFPVTTGSSTTFTVRFTPSAAGLRSATVNIANNDADENPYDFAVQGTGLASAPPIISENTLSPFINLPANGSGFLSGTVGDVTDPAQSLGVDLTIDDPDTPVGSLVVTAVSSNQAVVPNANLNLTGSGANRNLKITPAGIGYSTITVTVSDGGSSANYVINYAASIPSNNAPLTRWHTGKSDASTAVAIDSSYMFVADDEDQGLRIYDRNQSGLPLNLFDFTANLGLTDISGGIPREVDIEASAQTGNRIFWLGSHSNAASGNNRPNRSRIFATDISGAGAGATLSYVGRYDGLKTDLINWDTNNLHGLSANFFGLAASAATGVIPEAPDGSGFNIEGMVFAPDDTTVYIGFRAPIIPANNRTKALLVPITNAAALVSGNPAAGPAVFGAPIQLNLGGRGIREIKKNSANEYLIVAGDAAAGGNFATYSWTGNPADAPALRTSNLTGLRPESVVEIPVGLNSFAPQAAVQVQLLSDNGDDVFYGDGIIAKDLANNEFKKFRSDIVTVQAIAPTAANVSAAGRVLSAEGTGIRNAIVRVSNTTTGAIQTARTNSFGYFSVSNLPAGQTFIFEVQAKQYVIAPQVVSLTEDVADLTFVAEP
jgi:Carboxypeptidase regulatory-like domain/Abnormal spindle-like microcephaly-assoc'd, ASPM-SPD-2-Hydin/Protein of unknown function (DUF3616)